MSWMSILVKKTKTPRKTQKNNLKNTKYHSVNKRGPVLACQRGDSLLCIPSITPLMILRQAGDADVSTNGRLLLQQCCKHKCGSSILYSKVEICTSIPGPKTRLISGYWFVSADVFRVQTVNRAYTSAQV